MKKIAKWLHRQRILIFAVLVIALLGVGATMALFTDTEAAVNRFTVGKNTITVEETPVGLAKQEIGITNQGTVPVYVRMQVNAPDGIKYIAMEDGKETEKTLKVKYTPKDPDNWLYDEEDGFWYYREALPPEDQAMLFERVELVDSVTENAPVISTEQMNTIKELLDITVYGESVQSEGFPEEVMEAIKNAEKEPNGNPAKIAFEQVAQ